MNSAVERVIKILESEAVSLRERILRIEKGYITTSTNGKDDTQETLQLHREMLARLESARSLLV